MIEHKISKNPINEIKSKENASSKIIFPVMFYLRKKSPLLRRLWKKCCCFSFVKKVVSFFIVFNVMLNLNIFLYYKY